MSASFLTPERLAERWSITSTTLSQWRWSGKGPHYVKIGGRVLYRIPDVEEFEAHRTLQKTPSKNLQGS